MSKQKTEITGVLADVKFPATCEGFFFGKIRPIVDGVPDLGAELTRICGNAELDELKLHLTYRWYGKWETNEEQIKKWGPQFKVETFTIAKPHGRTGVIKYLQQAPHIGEATAIQLWNLFNSDAVRICREHPELISEKLPRLKIEQCQEIASMLADLSNLEDTSIELIDLLNGRGFPKATARACVKKWGNKSLRILQSDPYKLMAFRGAGWLRCDSMWMDLGLPPAKMKRQCYAIWYSLASDPNGNTWHGEDVARNYLKAKIAGVEVDFEKALALAKRAKLVREKFYCAKCQGTGRAMMPDLFTGEELVEATCPACKGTRGSRWLADERRASAEDRIAEYLAAAAAEDASWPEITAAPAGQRGPTEHQAAELQKAMQQGTIAMLLGSPGTGKTFVAAAVIQAILKAGGSTDVAICAPTGKAAVRCTESMTGYGISLRATTIHSLLGVAAADDDGGGWSFQHDENNPLPYRYIIVDESSMIAVPLMRSLLAARAKGAHVLFVGDPNQLPPIEHGAPLRDFITAGIPHGKLTEIKRNAGTIVRACAAIRDGRPFEIDPEIVLEQKCPACGGGKCSWCNGEGCGVCKEPCPVCSGSGKDPAFSPKNLKLITANKSQAPQAIEKLITELRDKGIDPIWQVQVIVAVNKRSPLARTVMNQRLQSLLNPGGVGVIGSPFKVNDKVICLKNSFFKIDDPGADDSMKVAVANGEFGKVYRVEAKKTYIEFFNPSRRVVVGRFAAGGKGDGKGDDAKDDKETGSGCDVDLGYACTCHKLQGSDADYIIVGLDEYPGATGPHGVCKREWAFTAISRARIACYLVGLRSTLRTQCAETSLDKRKTFLAELISQYRKSYLPGKEQPCPAIESLNISPSQPALRNTPPALPQAMQPS